MRGHYARPNVSQDIAEALRSLYDSLAGSRQIAFVCIGTDRSTGDCLGPLVGHLLSKAGIPNVYGTLEDPVHATNLDEKVRQVPPGTFVVAIDACLGRSEAVGAITVSAGPLIPGTGVGRNLPEVGDAHIMGTVNVGGFMEYFVLQNTRFNLVLQMAMAIAEGVSRSLKIESTAEAAVAMAL